MPQPVQPPETPAIIQPVATKDAANFSPSSTETPSAALSRSLLAGVIATPTPPEIFAPESSSGTAYKSAALLGPPISVNFASPPVANSPNDGLTQEEPPRSSVLPRSPVATSRNTNPPLPSLPTQTSSPARTNEAQKLQVSTSSDVIPAKSTSITLGTQNIKRLVAQERGGEAREFDFSVLNSEPRSLADETVIPVPNSEQTTPQPSPTPTPKTTPSSSPVTVGGVVELTADRQEYDEKRQVITAQGNVVLRFREALLNADRVQVNLPDRLIVADGNVTLTRGQQVLQGNRFEYYFVQDSGVILNASGELYTPTAGSDLSISTGDGSTTAPQRPLSERVAIDQPLQGISNPGGYTFGIGAGRTAQNLPGQRTGGTINRFRYQADRVDFEGSNAIAKNIRITNDPFSPPELELRADTARFTRLEPLVDEIVASRPRLVFDQGFELPLLRNRITIDRRPREPGLFNFGYDANDRGGLFIERPFNVFSTPNVRLSVTPQYFIQKAVTEGDFIAPSDFGLKAKLEGTLGPRTLLTGRAVLTTLDPTDLEENFRASARLQQIIGTTLPHTLSLEYSYRDRLFNGSLGFQTVRSSIGAVLSSPYIPLGKTGATLYYQASAQYINADTDRLDLLGPNPDNTRISLGRYQGLVSLSKPFLLWQGEALPATPTEGLRYTPTPVVPYLTLNTNLTGVATGYSSGDSQETLSGTVSLVGQLGHFSRPYLDYTGFNIGYTQLVRSGLSPFLFDRAVDTKVLSAGITQQIYGPFRLGVQTYINLDTGREISTDYLLEYSRRTYNILLRYNPVQQLGSISLRINDFNWIGNPGPFDEVRPARQGVTE
ncbi:MAG TPA: DUF3769 domain-containing protein [Waterburya sp.]